MTLKHSQPLLATLREVFERIGRHRPVEEISQLILERACQLVGAQHGSLSLVDHAARRLRIASVCGDDWTVEKRACRLAFDEGLSGRVAATGRARLCPDTLQEPDYFELFAFVRSELVVPVTVRGQVWGVISIDALEPRAFAEDDLSLLSLFAEITAMAIGVHLDVADQRFMRDRMVHSDKLAALGESLAGVAHEVNNPLTSIIGMVSRLEEKALAGDAGAREMLRTIVSEAKRASTILKNVLTFARKEPGERTAVDLNELVRQVATLSSFKLRESHIRLDVANGPEPVKVVVNAQEIMQVLLNLVGNAEHAIDVARRDGMIRLAVESSRQVARITVIDNGRGIPAELQEKIFDPFFTTKPAGEGSGLGLSISRSIMEANGGAINFVASTPVGTIFNLELPLAGIAAAPVPARRPVAPAAPQAPRRRVLIVDDEPSVLEAVGDYLRKLGVQVTAAGSGVAALGILQAESFDLIVCDVRMNGMDGMDLFLAATRHDAHNAGKFILMSGATRNQALAGFLREHAVPFIEKPFTFDELHERVAPFLSAGQAAAVA